MRSTHPEDQRGPRPAWNGIGFGLVAVAVALFVVFSPSQRPVVEDDRPTISLDDFEAMLSDSAGPPPATVDVETPDGPVTVLIPTTTRPPSTTQRPATTTTTTVTPTTTRPTTTTTTTTTLPRHPRDPLQVGADILDDLPPPAVTLPEGVTGER